MRAYTSSGHGSLFLTICRIVAGNPVNALYGFARFLSDFLEHSKPEFVAVAFDTSLTTCFRNDIYPAYKANRDPAPDELKLQFERCRALTRSLGLPEYAEQRFEADDIIGTLVTSMRQAGYAFHDPDARQRHGATPRCW